MVSGPYGPDLGGATIWFVHHMVAARSASFEGSVYPRSMRNPYKKSIRAAWTPHQNQMISRHMGSGGATPAATKRLGIWDHMVAPPLGVSRNARQPALLIRSRKNNKSDPPRSRAGADFFKMSSERVKRENRRWHTTYGKRSSLGSDREVWRRHNCRRAPPGVARATRQDI